MVYNHKDILKNLKIHLKESIELHDKNYNVNFKENCLLSFKKWDEQLAKLKNFNITKIKNQHKRKRKILENLPLIIKIAYPLQNCSISSCDILIKSLIECLKEFYEINKYPLPQHQIAVHNKSIKLNFSNFLNNDSIDDISKIKTLLDILENKKSQSINILILDNNNYDDLYNFLDFEKKNINCDKIDNDLILKKTKESLFNRKKKIRYDVINKLSIGANAEKNFQDHFLTIGENEFDLNWYNFSKNLPEKVINFDNTDDSIYKFEDPIILRPKNDDVSKKLCKNKEFESFTNGNNRSNTYNHQLIKENDKQKLIVMIFFFLWWITLIWIIIIKLLVMKRKQEQINLDRLYYQDHTTY